MSSSVFKWPDAAQVEKAARDWAAEEARHRPELLWLAYFGSYARGDWGVGSDLDLIAIVREAGEPFHRRALGWDTSAFPVPVDLLIYTAAEWKEMRRREGKFFGVVEREAVPLFHSGETGIPAGRP